MNNQDLEKVRLLTEYLITLGFQKNTAKILAYLHYNPDRTAMDIEFDMEMRQPEVSVALQYCLKKNWIKDRKEKRESKGRPMKIHRLNRSVKEIVEEYIIELPENDQIKNTEIFEKIKELS